MKKEKTTEEKAAIERKLAIEIDAEEERKRKQLEKEMRLAKEASERFTRVTVRKDKRGREMIIRPHKFPRYLHLGSILQTAFMMPFIYFLTPGFPGEETLPAYLVSIIRVLFTAVIWLIMLWLIVRKDLQTWTIRINRDGNFYIYGRNSDRPKAFGRNKDFSGRAWMKGDTPLCGVVDFTWPGRSQRLTQFSKKDVETMNSFLESY